MRWLALPVMLLACSILGAPAWAKSPYLPVTAATAEDPAALAELEKKLGYKGAFTYGMKKAATLPKRVAVVGFEVTWFRQAEAPDVAGFDYIRLQIGDDAYQEMTDRLYDQLVLRLGEMGFDVVPRETLVAAAPFAELEERNAKDNQARTEFAASGLKVLPRGGAPGDPNIARSARNGDRLVRLAQEVGADAILQVVVTYMPCFPKKGAVSLDVKMGVCGGVPTLTFSSEPWQDPNRKGNLKGGFAAGIGVPYMKSPGKYTGLAYAEPVAKTSRFMDIDNRFGVEAATFAEGTVAMFDIGIAMSRNILQEELGL